ncbi:hypothetical protein CASFOL_012615 [Castilleja foliolosa]|uniref:ATP synthase F0 subunit 8 n=1 Tax=Castilleja foliolosa TaxID=1961234 RepID=A0ABD3DLQ4_9LAMI
MESFSDELFSPSFWDYFNFLLLRPILAVGFTFSVLFFGLVLGMEVGAGSCTFGSGDIWSAKKTREAEANWKKTIYSILQQNELSISKSRVRMNATARD